MKFNLRKFGIVLGPALFLLILFIPTPEEMSDAAKMVFAISVWMIVWWITGAIPIYATALLPMGLIPTFGILPVKQIAAYMHPIIVLLLGMLAIELISIFTILVSTKILTWKI